MKAMPPLHPPVPIVAVPADVKELDGYRWHAVVETYLNAVLVGIGGIPLILPSFGERIDLDALLERVDGVLVPGSRTNVHPGRYGEPASPKSEPYDERRDATTLPLIRAAIRHGVPLFAICRGMQELNVALGGTLVSEIQEVEGRHDHRAPVSDRQDERFAIRQDVQVAEDTALARIIGAGAVRVNSLHRQGIGRLADRLVVEATASDGTIEAVRVADATGFAIGVQWHPEYWVASDEPSAKLFAAFAKAIRARMTGRGNAEAAIAAE
jgi:putative glutamine amidotransferase